MKTELYVIYDSAAGVYNRPFHQLNEAVALRTFLDLVSDQNTDPGRHPEHFSLFHIGSYNDENARFGLVDAPVYVANGHELLRRTLDKEVE